MRVPSGRLILAAACCAAAGAVPASSALATSHVAMLSIHTGGASKVPVKRFTARPARPAGGDHGDHARTLRTHRTRLPRHRSTGLSGRVTAHAAGDPGVAIADFHFSPATTTIHVGDTVTWSNSGPSSHTATAGNGSFNTGILKKGQSASHTFTQPGTFAYVCQIHSFMHGTIVVLASTTSTTTSPAATTPTTTTPGAATTSPTPTATTAAAQTGPTLPNTGFSVLAGLCAGLVLLGAGAGLRRTRPR
ncbi:MAG TPA: cupredoxin family copper-binding protein [Solirubrobacteraceae bacterium]|jgi:plastocyanin|nr:cupredoxin family copper-binding protein [Solirubrobacteraceae bacterium]